MTKRHPIFLHLWVAFAAGTVACSCTPTNVEKMQTAPSQTVSEEAPGEAPNSVVEKLTVQTENLGELPRRVTRDNIYVCFDGQHFTYVTKNQGRYTQCINLKPDPEDFDNLTNVIFSDNGHYAYVGYNAGVPYLVHDGKEAQRIATGDVVENLIISKDGRRVALLLDDLRSASILCDNEFSAEYVSIRDISFSDDGESLRFVGVKDDQATLVIEGKEVATFDKISAVQYNPATGEPLIVGEVGETTFVQYRDDRYPLSSPKSVYVDFSPNGSHYIFRETLEDDQVRIWIDGKLDDGIHRWPSFVFSHDDQHLAYVAPRESGDFLLVVDGERNVLTTPTHLVGFLSDGRLVTVETPEEKPVRIQAGDDVLAEDKRIDPRYVEITPHGKHVHYVIQDGEHFHFGIDGTLTDPVDSGFVRATGDDSIYLVTQIDDESIIKFQNQELQIGKLLHIAHAPNGERLWVLEEFEGSTRIHVIDGHGSETTGIVPGTPLMPGFVSVLDFTSDDKASLIMLDDQSCMRATIELERFPVL